MYPVGPLAQGCLLCSSFLCLCVLDCPLLKHFSPYGELERLLREQSSPGLKRGKAFLLLGRGTTYPRSRVFVVPKSANGRPSLLFRRLPG